MVEAFNVLRGFNFLIDSKVLRQPRVRLRAWIKMVGQPNQYAESVLNPQLTMISSVCSIKSYIEEGVLRQKYLVEKLSIRQISWDLLCSKSTVIKYLDLYGIPSRQVGSTKSCKPNLAFGEKRYGKTILNNRSEQMVIKMIAEMYRRNLSLREISRRLNQMAIPTKSGKSTWHHEVVRSIVKREGLQSEK